MGLAYPTIAITCSPSTTSLLVVQSNRGYSARRACATS
jgi:hypothetical protein